MWKEITLNASSDETQYRVWDYPIKEQYGHILLAIERAGTLPNASVGFQKVRTLCSAISSRHRFEIESCHSSFSPS